MAFEILSTHSRQFAETSTGQAIVKAMSLALLFTTSIDPYGVNESISFSYYPTSKQEERKLLEVMGLRNIPNDNVHLSINNLDTAELGILQEAIILRDLTKLRCGVSVNVALSYLCMLEDLSCYRVKIEGSNLKYFEDHVFAVVYDKSDDRWYAFSPANAFNPDSSLPSLNGEPFQRLSTVLMASTFEELAVAMKDLEGGDLLEFSDLKAFMVPKYNTCKLLRQLEED